MSQITRLRGRNALSAFRAAKLSQSVASTVSRIASIEAEYWHFAQLARALSQEESARFERVLTYGPGADRVDARGDLFLVVPRLGTISPWSSKATEIARQCGLPAVERVERGTAYWVRTRDGSALAAQERDALGPLLHD